MKQFVEKHFIYLAIVVVFVLVLAGAILSFYNKTIMKKALQVQEQADELKEATGGLFDNVQNMDISGRGFALMGTEEFLFLKPKMQKRLIWPVSTRSTIYWTFTVTAILLIIMR